MAYSENENEHLNNKRKYIVLVSFNFIITHYLAKEAYIPLQEFHCMTISA